MNTTFRIAPWADCLFAMDRAWWVAHADELQRVGFPGLRATICHGAHRFGAHAVKDRGRILDTFSNSGCGAVSLAKLMGAWRVIMVGYDLSVGQGGERHWHGNHPPGLGNAGSMPKWHVMFKRMRHALGSDVPILNATRGGALDLFPRVNLDDICAS